MKSSEKILVVDDNNVIRNLAKKLLKKKNYEVRTAENGKQAIDMAHQFMPTVIMMDVMMPEMNGYDACEKLKADTATKDIPVIMVTSKTDIVDKIKGFDIGAADYIVKPFDHGELLARVSTQVKMKNLWDEVQEKNRILEELIKKDGLTGLFNHRHFQERLTEEFSRARRYDYPVSCMMMDIDHFKNVNDNHGHQAGDEVLRSIADVLRENVRDVDIAARYGGEEFTLLLPYTDMKNAAGLAERIRQKVDDTRVPYNENTISVTMSIGVADMAQPEITNAAKLVTCCDDAMYLAKKKGRNCVVLYGA